MIFRSSETAVQVLVDGLRCIRLWQRAVDMVGSKCLVLKIGNYDVGFGMLTI